MGAAVEAEGVAAALVWPRGVVVLTDAMHVWAVLGFGSDSGRPPVRLADPPVASDMRGSVRLEVLDPSHTLSGGVEVGRRCDGVWGWPTRVHAGNLQARQACATNTMRIETLANAVNGCCVCAMDVITGANTTACIMLHCRSCLPVGPVSGSWMR